MDNSIICLGISGFPNLRTASVKKAIYLNKIFVDAGLKTLVINSESVYDNAYKNIALNGVYEGIDYITTVNNIYQQRGFFAKKIQRFLNKTNEISFLLFNRSMAKTQYAILFTNGSFWDLLVYRFTSLIKRFKLILVYHELRSDFDYRKNNFFLKINDKIFDRYFFRFVDGVFPISEYLIEHLNKIKCNKPYIKVPVLVDLEKYPKEKTDENFFLFCGSAGFKDIVEFVISAFEMITDSNIKLYLVLSGQKKEALERINRSNKKHLINVLSDITDEELFSLYSSAKALLIPLKNEFRDIARFPQKIAEYVCSGNPVISTNFGEMKYYFEDTKNALLASDYNEILFAEKMTYVIANPKKSKEIGEEGLKIGLENFNYASYSEKVKSFFDKINLN